MTIHDIRVEAIKQLHTPTPQLDVDVLLQYVTGHSRSWLLAHNDECIDDFCTEKDFFTLIKKRSTGLPIAYITNSKEFYGYDFYVTPDVLIPKPDTELLVEMAIDHLLKMDKKFSTQSKKASNKAIQFADICTGSGCIAISVLKSLHTQLPIECYCTDISEPALTVAQKNAKKLLPNLTHSSSLSDMLTSSHISFLRGDLCVPLKENGLYDIDIIVSNPPYVPANITNKLLADGRSEPRLALDGDATCDKNGVLNYQSVTEDGMAVIRRLVPQVYGLLKKDGIFLIETGEYNADKTARLMEKQGFCKVKTFYDMAGLKRVTCGIK